MYNKLFTKILDSSIWLEDHATRIVWITFIAVMDEDGMCHFASVANVARRAAVSLDEAQRAINLLESPDPISSDPEFEGRRVERVPGGWLVRNAEKYREQATRVTIREKTRERVRKHRELQKNQQDALPYEECNACVTPSGAEAIAESDTELSVPSEPHPDTSGKRVDPYEAIYEAYPRKEGRRAALKKIMLAVKRLESGEHGGHRMTRLDAQRWLFKSTLAYAESPAGRQEDKQRIPHPTTWYNQSRYLDDRTNWNVVATGGYANGQFNRSQARTNGNIAAARAATEKIAGNQPAHGPGRGTPSVH